MHIPHRTGPHARRMQALLWIPMLFCCGALLEAQTRNVQISIPGTEPEEVTIAVNPTNPLNIVVGANLDYTYYSTDGGRTWEQREMDSQYGVWGDPSVAFDPSGVLYFAHLSNPPTGYWLDRLVVQRSTDGGAGWTNGASLAVAPPTQQDKEWLAADFTNGPRRGRLYITWTQFAHYGSTATTDSSFIFCSYSSDGGSTWSPASRISDAGGDCIDSDSTVQGAIPAVGPNGEVYTCWSDRKGLMFDRSLDGGVTFGRDTLIETQPGGWDYSIPGLQRCNGFPITLCDIGNGPRRGAVYVVWSDQRNGADNTDVFMMRSDDGGKSWSPRRRVNADTGRAQQFMTWAALDPVNGDLYVVYYDRRAGNGLATEVYVARTADGGETFTERRVSDTSFVPNTGTFLGDYIGIAAYGGKAYPVWARMDGSRTSIWTTTVDMASDVPASRADLLPARAVLEPVSRSATDAGFRVDFDLPRPCSATVAVVDILGETVRLLNAGGLDAGRHTTWWDGKGADGGRLAGGVYFVVLEAAGTTEARAVQLGR
ncbi:MAG: glycosyl hydrolase [Bacteroidetes bacterium]|nr:glycosyl hydrolase [Bacteroidota bacterium]